MLARFHRTLSRLRAFFSSEKYETDLDGELAEHLNLLADEHIRRGVSPEEAHRLARIEFGGIAQLKESHRETRAIPFLDVLLQDLRYAFRTIRRNVGFTVFTILIVGLGIGASSTVFSVVNALLLRPLPFSDSNRLVWIANRGDDGIAEWRIQVNHFLDLRQQNKSFSDLTAYNTFFTPGDAKLFVHGETESLNAIQVTQNFFPLLGVQPILGRTFSADECKFSAPRTTLISYRLWQRRFASDPDIVGQTLRVSDTPTTVIGVLPPSFDFATVFSPGASMDFFYPMPLSPETNNFGNTLGVLGRLRPDSSLTSAKSEFVVLAAQLEKLNPDRNTLRPVLMPLAQHVTGHVRPALLILTCAVGIVMLIVCANIANLQLARTASRQKEIAIRAAIGAGQRRLIRQLLTESLVLSLFGSIFGITLAAIGVRLLTHLTTFNLPLLSTLKMDAFSLSFSVLLAVVSGVLFGLAPALQVATFSIHDSLKDSNRGSTNSKRHHWIRNGLVVSEIVFACVLLVGAGLLLRSFVNVLDVQLGFHPERAASIRVDPNTYIPLPANEDKYFTSVLQNVRAIPGVSSAGLTDMLPLAGDRSWALTAPGRAYKIGEYPEGFVRYISDGYFESMGIPLIAGRSFTERDQLSTEPVVIVNQTLAKSFWPGQDPLGQMILADGIFNDKQKSRVIGIVGDVHHRGLEQDSGNEIYHALRQAGGYGPVYLVVRTQLPPATLASAVREALHPIAPELARNEFKTIQQLVDTAVSPRRFIAGSLAAFSTFALILAALGIYAVISYSVTQRTAELGIRMALGASAATLQSQIVLQTLRLAAVGMLLGTIAAFLFAQALATMLFNVKFTDPATFAAMLLTLTFVAALAGYLPALRVSRIDPLAALRSD